MTPSESASRYAQQRGCGITSCAITCAVSTPGASGTPITMSTTPATMKHRPTRSRFRSGSFRKKEARIALQKTPTEPTGVTTDAGAKPYATRLPSSPKTLRSMPTHQSGSRVNGRFGSRRVVPVAVVRVLLQVERTAEMTPSAMTERMTPTIE